MANDELLVGVTTDIEETIHERHKVIPRHRYRRSNLVSLVVEASPSAFVDIRVHSWFVVINERKFPLYDPSGRVGADLAEMQIGEEMRWVPCTRSGEYCGQQLFVFR